LSNIQPDSARKTNGDANIVSFIVRIWREEIAHEDRQPIWRGHITSVPIGRRHYFRDIGEIPDLIKSDLKLQK
jgi:hypothetical protein